MGAIISIRNQGRIAIDAYQLVSDKIFLSAIQADTCKRRVFIDMSYYLREDGPFYSPHGLLCHVFRVNIQILDQLLSKVKWSHSWLAYIPVEAVSQDKEFISAVLVL